MTSRSPRNLQKNVLIIGGRDHTVKKVQALGVRYSMLQSNDLVTPLQYQTAQRYLVTDYRNLEEVVEVAKLWHALDPFDAIVSFAEYGLHAASVCARSLGLPGQNEEAVVLTRDKFKMRNLLKGKNLSSLEYALCHSMEDVQAFFRALGGRPMILKPYDGGGSIGISYVDAPERVQEAWEWTRSACKGLILAEEFVDGPEYSVESISKSGRHEIVMITEKLTTDVPHFIELGHQAPARLSPADQQQVVDVVTQMLEAIGQQTAPAHTEIRLSSQGVKIIESQTRIGGDQIWEMAELATGVDLQSETVCELLGLPMPERRPQAPAAAIRFFAHENRTLTKVDGVEAAGKAPGVVRLSCTLRAGVRLGPLTWSESRQGYALCVGDTVEQAVANAERAVQMVAVESVPHAALNIAIAFPIGPLSLYRYLDVCKRNAWSALVLGAESFRQQAEAAGAQFVPAELDTVDPERLAEQLRGRGLSAVVPGGEYSVAMADRIAAALGLPHNPIAQGQAFRNKAQMRARFAQYNVPQPRILARFTALEEVDRFGWEDVAFPLIVKPIDMASSMFVRVCANAADAKALLTSIFQYVEQGAEGLPFSRGALVEELATGQEYSAECLVEDGKLLSHFLTTKYLSPSPHCNEVGHLSGDDLPAQAQAELAAAVDGIIAAWGVTDTVMHVEFKLTPQGLRVIEAGNRVAGDRISELVQLRYGVSLEECFCRLRAHSKLALAPTVDNAAAPYVGVKFFFGTQQPAQQGLSVVREESWPQRVEMSPMVFDIKQRLGFRIVTARERAPLDAYLCIDAPAA
jgi:biotin carboxylase